MAPVSTRRALAEASRHLAQKGVAQGKLDAQVLLAHVLGTSRLTFHVDPDQALTALQESSYKELIARRAAGEPVAYLCGEKEFFSLTFSVDRSVLIPRPETEQVVEAVLEKLDERASQRCPVNGAKDEGTFFDVGTGSGAIAVAVLVNRPASRAIASDLTTEALAVARRNADRHRVADRLRLIEGDLFGDFPGEVDVVVSNPPYVGEDERDRLPPEVRDYEPAHALFAGRDGLAVIRRLIDRAPRHLPPGGWLVFEIGYGHDGAARDLIERDRRWADVEIRNDLAGIPRVVLTRKR